MDLDNKFDYLALLELEDESDFIFVGRDSYLQAFEAFLANESSHHVLYFYGIGGIGKSSLLKEIQQTLNIKSSMSTKTIHIEFDPKKNEKAILGPIDFMREVRRQMKGTWEQFLDFDLTCLYYAYFKKIPFSPDHLPFLESRDSIEDFNNGIDYLMNLHKADSPTIMEKLRKIRKGLNELPYPKDLLLKYFASDFSAFYEQHPTFQIVYVIDTYEVIHTKQRQAGNQVIDWVESIYKRLPRAKWVVAGRERVLWANNDTVDPLELNYLNDEMTLKMLQQYGIEDKSISAAIYESTNGYPLYIILAKDAYFDLIDQKKIPTVDSFKHVEGDDNFTERMLSFFSEEDQTILNYLALTTFYTYDIYCIIMRHFNYDVNIDKFKRLERFSFVQKQDYHASTQEDDQMPHNHEAFTFNSIIQDVLLKTFTDHERIKTIHTLLWQHYKGILFLDNEINKSLIFDNPRGSHKLLLAGYHHGKYLLDMGYIPLEELITWVRKIDLVFLDTHQNYLTIPLLMRIRDELKETDFESYTILDYDISYIYMAEMYQYEKVEPHFLRILEERKMVLGEGHSLTAKANYGLGLLYCRWNKGAEGIEYHRIGYNMRENLIKQYPQVPDYAYALALSANSMGRYFLDNSNLNEAFNYLKIALAQYDKSFTIQDRITVLKDEYQGNYITAALNYVVCLLKLKKYKDAHSEGYKCLDFAKEYLDKNQIYYCRAQSYLSVCGLKLKIEENVPHFMQEAIQGLLIAKDRLEAYFKEKDHIELAKVIHNLAIAYYCEGQVVEASEYAKQSYEMKMKLIEKGQLRKSRYNFKQTEALVQAIENSSTVQQMEFNF